MFDYYYYQKIGLLKILMRFLIEKQFYNFIFNYEKNIINMTDLNS